GARVIKVERPGSGDACRQLATKNIYVDGDSLVFHSINRNKESFAANLKDPDDLEKVFRLIDVADVMTHNFRPGVMEKIGLDFDSVAKLNPRIIYGEVTGYGRGGPWKDKPGQDLLAQALSGLTHLTGNADQTPIPFGLATGDMVCGTHLAQGILAALIGRGKTGRGCRVEVSLLESLIDLQFEVLTTFLNDGGQPPQRAEHRNAHAYLGAPYGIYETRDGYIAISMGSLDELGKLIECRELAAYAQEPGDAFRKRKEIKRIIASALKRRTTDEWLLILEPADFWCSDVYNYGQLMRHAGYEAVDMEQVVHRSAEVSVRTTRCPIRIDGRKIFSDRAAPLLGEANERLAKEVFHG
ncbi:MAG: CaiB/BaiF CoA transferase family protein, partial [Rhodopirellula sp. JB044]|uniref:CaiB/BaiF CoA transferase family protein n=1 Tax=Rhodopirellula sp. JB044 TaxID=3342844 RepID=UPI00370C1E72